MERYAHLSQLEWRAALEGRDDVVHLRRVPGPVHDDRRGDRSRVLLSQYRSCDSRA